MKFSLSIALISLLFSSISFSAISKNSKNLPLWKKIALNDYLKNTGKSVEIKQISGDSKSKEPNFYIISSVENEKSRKLVMQLFDFDRDKNIDLAKHFEDGKLVRSEWSLDRDDMVDVVKFHDKDTGILELKLESLGENSIAWSHYFKGELRQKEVDRNSDGTPDLWYHYKADKIIKVESAKDFDPNKIEDLTKSMGL